MILTPDAPRISAQSLGARCGASIQGFQGFSQGRQLLAPLHPADRLGARHRFGLLNCGDGHLLFG